MGLGRVAPGYCWLFADFVRSTGGVCGRVYFLSPESELVLGLCSLMQGVLQLLHKLPLVGDPVQQLRVEVFIHSMCTELYWAMGLRDALWTEQYAQWAFS